MFMKSRETDRLNSRVRVSLLHGKLELKPSYQKTETERVKSGRPESGKASKQKYHVKWSKLLMIMSKNFKS